ncbi:MAG: hypothetical protein IT353_01005 [Gemmatimonadaceae bacterium]|nr:hypothetical protein [Gemmatimonadaceae bacterium]
MMQVFKRTRRVLSHARQTLVPAFVLAATAVAAQVGVASGESNQPKPELKVEAERSPQGAKLTFKGKNWAPNAQIKITGTRAPGASSAQDFGTFTSDSAGGLSGRKVVGCTTNNMDDGQSETVTVTAYDVAAATVKVTQKVAGGAWVCQ